MMRARRVLGSSDPKGHEDPSKYKMLRLKPLGIEDQCNVFNINLGLNEYSNSVKKIANVT